jgi:hypothetical protein
MAARKFLVPIDFTKNEIQNAALQNLASAPGTPVEGQMYWDTVGHRAYFWNNNASAWQLKATDSDLLQGQNSAYHLARANHTGTQTASTVSDLATVVQGYRLDQFAAPNASVAFNGQKITGLGTPTGSTDAVTKAYVDTLAQGLTPKPTAQVATAAVLAACTYANGAAGVGATLTGNSNGALTVDAYAVLLNDLVMVKNQASGFQNGLYTQTQLGDASHPFILTRHVDMDQATEFAGAFIAVENNGATTLNTLWLCNVAASITVGTTAVTFTQLNPTTGVVQGNGISISGTTITFLPDPAAGKGLLVTSAGAALDTAVAVRKFAIDVGDGSSASIVITHNLGTLDVTVALYNKSSPFSEADCDVQHTSTNTVTLVFAVAPTAAQYRAVVHG